MSIKARYVPVLGLGLALGLSACGGSGAAKASSSGAPDTIIIKNFGYSPTELSVAPGATVTVKNEDTSTHTVTANSGGFDTGDVAPGHSATFKAPSSAGTYAYHCAIHQFMHATLKVSG